MISRSFIAGLAPRLSAIVVAGALLLGPVSAAQFVVFSARRQGDATALYGNGQVLLRVRNGAAATVSVDALASRLNALALKGLHPSELTVSATQDSARILARGGGLVGIDKLLAAASRNTPRGLAETWVKNLQDFLRTPYVAVEPRDRLLVPLGEKRSITWGGTAAGEVTCKSLATEVATVQVDMVRRTATIQGLTKGATVVSMTIPGSDPLLVTVEVKPWAVQVSQPVLARVTSPPLPEDDLRRVLRNALLLNARPWPGAALEVGEPVGFGSSYQLRLRASGPNLLTFDQPVAVSLKVVANPSIPTRELLVSNLPERITTPGMLLRERLSGASAVRLLWHHVSNFAQPLRFAVRVANRGEAAADLHVTEAASGPARDEIFVGHTAMARFLRLWEQGEGYVLSVPAGQMVDLYDVRLSTDDIVSGVARVTPLSAGDLLLEVVAENSWPPDAYFVPVPDRLRQDPPLTPYRFEAEKTVTLSHEVGGAWTFYHVGKDYSENLQGQKLQGDYGVLYRLGATFKNPTTQAARCEIGLRASGGVARATLIINGETVETGLLQGAREQVIWKSVLPPGEEQQLAIRTVPESGSNYPLTLMLRSWQ